MKHPDDDALMAHADGEGDAAARAAIDARLATEPGLADRVRRHQALRDGVTLVYGVEIDEPVPQRVPQALAPPPPVATAATVTSLAAVRASHTGLGCAQWGGMAASLALGTVLGVALMSRGGALDPGRPDGRVLARGELARALSEQPAGPTAGPVQVALSFLDQGGRYCRAFVARDQAGLACRDGGDWALQVIAPQAAAAPASAVSGGLRQASTTLPPAVLQAVDERLKGQTLDAAAERAALAAGWQP